MKYKCEKVSANKAIVELLPVDNNIKSLNDMLIYHYSRALKELGTSAVLLKIEHFIKMPTKAVVSFAVV